MGEEFQVQTRAHDGELKDHPTIRAAFRYARERPDVWKISWPEGPVDRVRLVRAGEHTWSYEPFLSDEELEEALDGALAFIEGDALFPEQKKIKRNAVRCDTCGDVIESKFRHDYVTCSCGSVSVDGGLDYLKRGHTEGASFTDLSEEVDG